MEAPICSTEMRSDDAATGAPAQASTLFNPIARNNVLLPDILEPLTINMRCVSSKDTSFGTHWRREQRVAQSGLLQTCASETLEAVGAVQSGRSKASAANEERRFKLGDRLYPACRCAARKRDASSRMRWRVARSTRSVDELRTRCDRSNRASRPGVRVGDAFRGGRPLTLELGEQLAETGRRELLLFKICSDGGEDLEIAAGGFHILEHLALLCSEGEDQSESRKAG